MSAREVVERVGIARIEGRLENVLEREKQLVALHQSVSKRFDDFVRVLQKDLRTSKHLATSELVTALDAINALYGRLNFQDELAKERQLKNGGRSATFFVGLGTTLILQLSSCPVTSTLCPLAATLAAGNPAIVLGSPTLSSTNELIEQVIWEALDHEAFHFERCGDASNAKVYLQEKYAIAVINGLEASQTLGSRICTANPSVRLIEPYYGVPAGIIDRSGGHSVDATVKQIRQSVLDGPTGNPLRIPRLFFVDESLIASVKSQLHASQDKTSSQLDEWLGKQYRGLAARYPAKKDETQTIPEFPRVESATIVKSSSGSEIALVPARSLDHTIDTLNKINSGQGSQAIYIFAGGKEAFYLGNFINTSHVYINEIPTRALVSATGRSAGDTTTQAYCIEDFSETKTMLQIAQPEPHMILERPSRLDTKKVKQANGGRMSYFEQGLILGAAMGLVALTGLGFLSYRGYRAYRLR